MSTPSIVQGQIAIDPVNGILYYKTRSDELVHTSLNLLQESNALIATEDSLEVGGDFVVTGDFTVSGNTVILNTQTLLVEDNIIVLNSNVTGTPTVNAGIEINRGNIANVQIIWNETINKWQFTNDGTNYYDIGSVQTASINDLSDVVLSNSTNGDFLRYNGSVWINDPVNLATDTIGNYVQSLVSGTGVSLSNNSGEGSTPTISIGQDVSVSANVLFNTVSANLIGNVTGSVSDISTHGIDELSDVVLSNSANGDFLRYNGSVWINDPVNLSTDTIGNYVESLISGTGVSIVNNTGEGSTPTISIGQDVSTTANVFFQTVTANFVGNVTGSVSNISTHSINELSDVVINSAINGQILEFDGTNWVNTVRPSLEPMGFENPNDSSLDFTSASRQFSIQPTGASFTVWVAGKRFIKTSTETIQVANTSALYYIYYNSSGTLSQKNTFFNLENEAPVAYVYWNQSDNVDHIFADERHGVTMDWATHEYLHRTRGAAIANGFGANAYTTSGDGSLDAHAKIDIANGTFFDEDLEINITHSATPAIHSHQQILQGGAEIPMLYRTNTHFRKDAATKFPMKQGSARVTYNRYSAGVWSTTDIDNNKYGVTFIVATNDLHSPIQGIMGQNQYTDQGSAEAAKWEDLDLSDFPLVEWRPLYKIVYQTANAYVNTPHARITSVIDMRLAYVAAGTVPTTPVSDHGSMTGLSDNDHPQYLLVEDHDVRDHSNALSTASIDDLSDVVLSNSANGDFLRYNGSVWINDPVNLSTDTIGDYVKNIIAGEAIEIDVLSGEGATPTISIQDGSITSAKLSPTFEYVDRIYAGNNIVLSNDTGLGVVSPSIEVSATPSFEAVTTNELTIGAIKIDPFGAAVDEVLKFNGVKFAPGIASTVAALNDLTDVNAATPSTGDFLYWDGSEWTPSNPGTGVAIVSDTIPVSPIIGQLWFKSDAAQTFIYYDSQWVEIGTAAPPVTTVTKYVQVIGNGASSYSILHNLNTRNVVVEVYDNSSYETVTISVARTTLNSVTVSFAAPVSANAYTVVIIG